MLSCNDGAALNFGGLRLKYDVLSVRSLPACSNGGNGEFVVCGWISLSEPVSCDQRPTERERKRYNFATDLSLE